MTHKTLKNAQIFILCVLVVVLVVLAGCSERVVVIDPPARIVIQEVDKYILSPVLYPVVKIVEVEVPVVVYETVEVRLPEYHPNPPRSVEQFEKLLYESMALPLFEFNDIGTPDCDNYARQAHRYAATRGVLVVWEKVNQERYDEIFGEGQRVFKDQGTHMIVGAIIQNNIYYADYWFPIFTESGDVYREQYWSIVFECPVD